MKCFQTDTSKPFVIVGGLALSSYDGKVYDYSTDDVIRHFRVFRKDCSIVPKECGRNFTCRSDQMILDMAHIHRKTLAEFYPIHFYKNRLGGAKQAC